MSGDWLAQAVGSAGSPGYYCSLAVIGSMPAISYYEAGSGDLWYVAALDAKGEAWGSPEQVDSLGDVGTYTALAEVDGKAAISYFDGTNRDLKYAIRLGP